jgi:hypothetical protein
MKKGKAKELFHAGLSVLLLSIRFIREIRSSKIPAFGGGDRRAGRSA